MLIWRHLGSWNILKCMWGSGGKLLYMFYYRSIHINGWLNYKDLNFDITPIEISTDFGRLL